jgi:NADPH:quinone reductase-like Zn-dependent oxidoreductase
VKAIVITAPGGPEVLAVNELPDPLPAAGEILIRVRAFGLNHAEAYMRSGAWGKVAQVPGIECAGTVQADPSGRLAAGTAVVAILGGLGRTRNGSHAELVTVPASNVIPVTTSLSWTDLVALPEVYATAWAGLHQNLDLQPGQTVLVRGATSAFVLGTPSFPLTDIPLQQMVARAEAGRYQAKPARVFGFDEIVQAHQAMEQGQAAGKMVVAVS